MAFLTSVDVVSGLANNMYFSVVQDIEEKHPKMDQFHILIMDCLID